VTRAPGVVLDPLPGSLAEKSGILSRDILLSIDSIPLTDPSEIQLRLTQKSDPLKLEILR